MKHLIATVALVFATFLGTTMNAQSYKTGAGILVDFGDGSTYVGPQVKHFFSKHGAGEFSVLFGDNQTVAQANYQYQQRISGAKGLDWYIGVGPAVLFGEGYTNFAPSAMLGLDFKLNGIPLAFSFDWRPRFVFYEGGSDFTAGRFNFGGKFTF